MRNINALAKKHINDVLGSRKLTGSNQNCLNYSCHFEGQDCTWCYCPLYPCLYDKNGGYIISGTGRRIWDCSSCTVVHEGETAKKMLTVLRKSGKRIEDISSADIASARRIVAGGK
ncbi:MAG: cysteine-rich small domain-containing protein [Candidatus Hydrothermarchaeales archaeon]